MIDAASQCEETLVGASDIVLDLLRRHARKESGHNYHRNLDRREEVDRHLEDACNADDTNDEANYNDQIGIADGKFGHSRMTILFYSVFLSLITARG